jgi:hypothetical protein
MSLPDSSLLTGRSPPAPYERYATCADIDRVPVLFLGDLVTETPQYAYPECGSFYTFGWCSEREMAFTALMTAWGFDAKIWQTGIHTMSEVWCEFNKLDGTMTVMAARVDNTFASVMWEILPATTTVADWLKDMGAGTETGWYNRQARSRGQIDALRNIPVGDEARARIQAQVRAVIRGNE